MREQIISEAGGSSEREKWITDWNTTIIDHNLEAAESTVEFGYPLFFYVLYGDFQSSMEIVRQYTPSQIFSEDSPLITEIPACDLAKELSVQLNRVTASAIEVEPELPDGWLLRGWGIYMQEPNSPLVTEYLERALLMNPEDTFLQSCLEFLKQR